MFKDRRTLWLTIVLATASYGWAGEKDGRLDIYWVDVEGGAATLIVTPAGESVLIDSGNPGYRDPNRIVQLATKEAGLRRIDHLITTHYHRDHFGGAPTLATLIPIGTVHDNGVFDGMPNDPGKPYWEFDAAARRVINPGDKLSLRQGVTSLPVSLQCLGTRKQFIAAGPDVPNCAACAAHRPKDRDGSDNANSVVTLLEFGSFRFYDGGDLTWNQEFRLVCPKNVVGRVDVYQVTHHGLASSNNPVLLNALQPHVAIMNNGKTKGCMPDVFANLKATKSIQAIYQLHRNERPDGQMNNVEVPFIANRSKEVTGNHIHLSVAANGKSYTVTIPAHDESRTYQTVDK
ncbi:MAG TPA: MBL fold metallo-hydrolase [Planctomycetes bacterium]|nr:MBL fold metallo-hydrolase [Planctomycetaceae bacterium]HIM31567.1 MBL fold metallo-hydrolase [Planctomycetota bacterium]